MVLNWGSGFNSLTDADGNVLQDDAGNNLDQLIAGIMTDQGARQQSAREFDVNANQNKNNQFLQGLQALFGMGEANTNTFKDVASQGIVNPETIATPSLGSQLLQGGLSALTSYLGSGGKFGLGGDGSTSSAGGGQTGAFKISKPFQMPNIKSGTGYVGEPTVGSGPTMDPNADWNRILNGLRL